MCSSTLMWRACSSLSSASLVHWVPTQQHATSTSPCAVNTHPEHTMRHNAHCCCSLNTSGVHTFEHVVVFSPYRHLHPDCANSVPSTQHALSMQHRLQHCLVHHPTVNTPPSTPRNSLRLSSRHLCLFSDNHQHDHANCVLSTMQHRLQVGHLRPLTGRGLAQICTE